MSASHEYHSLFILTICSLILAVCRCSLGATRPRDQAQQTIESGITYLLLVYDEIHVREKQTIKEPVLLNKYKQCGVAYTGAVNALGQSIDSLKSGDYQKVITLASTALQDIQNCDNIFTPPGTETRFKSLSQKSLGVATNLLAVVKGLPP